MKAPVETNNPLMLCNPLRNPFQYAIRISYCVLFLLLSACRAPSPATPFIAPRSPKSTPSAAVSPTVQKATLAVSATATPASAPTSTESPAAQISATPEPPTPEPNLEPTSSLPKTCSDSLKYLEDLNYPDGSVVAPGQAIDKQWRVENDGSCDWDGSYRLKLVDQFPALGAETELALFPARAGTQATLTINFVAPLEAGTYRTAWQAYNSEGLAFGETVYMVIVVSQ
jgi:hypothetical protein